jgi:hypothetical protein
MAALLLLLLLPLHPTLQTEVSLADLIRAQRVDSV